MKSTVAVLFAAFAIVSGVPTGDNGKEFSDATSGQLIDYYTCTAQGNYPDPRDCDHYIACTTALLAYKMPCALGHDGLRLFYVPESGPSEQTSYCDYRYNVQCSITAAPPPTSEAPPATTEAPPKTTEAPPKTTEATPTTSGPGNPPPSCAALPEAIVGNTCDPEKDCKQCGYCDEYIFCDPATKTWTSSPCDLRAEADGTVLVKNKLFWNPDQSSEHGGICDFFSGLSPANQDAYKNDPQCKPICEFEKDPTCPRKYFYTDPSFDDGIWKAEPTQFYCPKGTEWDIDGNTCVFCKVPGGCDANC